MVLRLWLALAAGWLGGALGCTTLILGKKATSDGSVMATHTNDGEGITDPRLVKVPAMDWPAGSMRPVFPSPENYPRYVGTARGVEQYYPKPGQEESVAVGYIPQVNHTWAYFEETYGVMNEKQVAIGESTCSAVYTARSLDSGGKALFSIDELSRVAMERASTAREAVQLMGDLGVEYGFHGQSGSFEGSGESLMVIDPEEGFVFHILPDPTGASAIWVAARVPDDSMAVVANMFSIRQVNLSDTQNFLGRQDMWDLAQSEGLWNASMPYDFTATFSDGEYAHRYYSGRRMWGAWRLAAPSFTASNLSPEYENLRFDRPYPFAVAVETPLAVSDVIAINRDWYQATPYDQGVGMAAGFGGTPDRYGGCKGNCSNVTGNWERPIALYRSSDTYVVQSRGWLPNSVGGTIWFAPHAAHGTVYVPLAAGMASAPREYSDGWQGQPVSEARRTNGGFWASRLVENVMQMRFQDMLPVVRAEQEAWEAKGLRLQAALSEAYAREGGSDDAALTARCLEFARDAVKAWWSLSDDLLFTYADGFHNYWKLGTFHSSSIGYPAWWMNSVGYENGPPSV